MPHAQRPWLKLAVALTVLWTCGLFAAIALEYAELSKEKDVLWLLPRDSIEFRQLRQHTFFDRARTIVEFRSIPDKLVFEGLRLRLVKTIAW